MSAVSVGERCSCGGHYGTVKYIGAVPPSSGEWIGVEWDDASRGKHSGTHEGVQYFTCSIENSGSFVRATKLDFGITFIDALMKKYDTDGNTDDEVPFVLKRKQHQFEELKTVLFDKVPISKCGNPDDIRATVPKLCETLLSSWTELALITKELPHLTELNLTRNKMNVPSDPLLLSDNSFKGITKLSLIRMELSWNELSIILQVIPNLIDLSVAHNNISTLHSQFLHTIESIDLSNNHLTDWSHILLLQDLPQLHTLLLGHNSLNNLTQTLSKGGFPVLRKLFLDDNCIDSWSSINALCQFTSLRELSVIRNPLLNNETVFFARQLVIARIPQLTVLQKSPINRLERIQAERDYVNKYTSEWTQAKNDTSTLTSFETDHPQYTRLTQIHGIAEKLPSCNTTTALKNRLIALTIEYSGQSIQRKLPDSLTIGKLKGMIQRLLHVDSTKQYLSYTCREGRMVIELNDDLKQLSYFSLQSGDTIKVNE